MKKNTHRILLILLSAWLILSLGACKQKTPGKVEEPYKPADAFALWDKIDETMNAVESMEVHSTIAFTVYNGGYEYVSTGTSYEYASKEVHYGETTLEGICEALSIEQNITQVEAYYDGKMYIAVDDGTYNQKLCTQMSYEEYAAVQSAVLAEDVDIKDCTGAKFSQSEDAGCELHFSGYTKKAMIKMLESMSISEDMLGAPIADMEVDLTAGADFCVEKMTITFTFDVKEGEALPVFSVVSEYSGYNTAVFDSTRLKTQEYTQVDDVRILKKVSESLQERKDAVSGKFTLDMKNTYVLQGQVSSSQEKDTITYGRKNGAYFYGITAQINGQNVFMRYQNNEQIVTMDGKDSTATQTDEEAKAFIDSLIDSANYTPNAVTDIQKESDGIYKLTFASLDVAKFNELMTSNGVEVVAVNQECIVTFEQNKLMKIDSKITVNGKFAEGTMSMTIETLVAFDDSDIVL